MEERIKAAVLVPVYRRQDDEIIIVLVRRTEGEVHGGQLAFPGGKVSPKDNNLRETVLRETREEIGLESEKIEIIEQLPDINTSTTRFTITPFLGRIIPPDKWELDKREIAELIEVVVADLMKPDAHDEIMNFPTWPGPRVVPYYKVGRYKLWGATYYILKSLIGKLDSI